MAAKNTIVKAAFELKSLHVCEKRSNILLFAQRGIFLQKFFSAGISFV